MGVMAKHLLNELRQDGESGEGRRLGVQGPSAKCSPGRLSVKPQLILGLKVKLRTKYFRTPLPTCKMKITAIEK